MQLPMQWTLTRRLDTILFPLLVTAVAYGLFVLLLLARHDGDASRFVTAGDQFADPQTVPANLYILPHSAGYDGQFYYRLALDPFTSQQTAFGITLDAPAYRHSRLLYPLLAWALSLGQTAAVPLVMLWLNYLALCALGGLAGAYAQSLGRHAAWGLLIPFLPGHLFTLARDLTEILALTFLFASLLLLVRKHSLAATLMLIAAVLTRETAFLWVGAVVLVWLRAKLTHRSGAFPSCYFLVPLITYGVWQLLLMRQWGSSAFSAGAGQFGLPLAGLVPFIVQTFTTARYPAQLWGIELLFLAGFSGAVLYVFPSSHPPRAVKLAWLLYGVAALCWTRLVWIEDWAYMRLLSEYLLFGALIVLASPSRLKLAVLLATLALWLYLVSDFVTTR